ncbi:uncharacterized protein PAC_15698 [Phialocephala subalpina]|uniref:C2H2-type domain-containing protein n=1 Tax=Phialocephala subalpina TaxID=576137 RepID=A0A1L7XLA4_9HELO|nr:uncharacterized protein PAC_15698 [Phialocephala subalpina]
MTSNRILLNATSSETPCDDCYHGMELISTISSSSGVQNAQHQQCTHLAARLETIESRLHALEFLVRRRREVASSSSSILETLDNYHVSDTSLSDNALCYGIMGSIVSDLADGAGQQHGRPSLDFAFDTDGHNGVEDMVGQRADHHTFDEMFDFDLASYAADANNGTDNYKQGAETQDVDTMVAVTPFDNAIALPAAATTSFQLNAMSAAPIATVAPPRQRHQCPNCGRTFLRPGDRDRHALKHNPNAQRYPCTYPGCRYSGMRAFLRKDKLREHRARHGH